MGAKAGVSTSMRESKQISERASTLTKSSASQSTYKTSFKNLMSFVFFA